MAHIKFDHIFILILEIKQMVLDAIVHFNTISAILLFQIMLVIIKPINIIDHIYSSCCVQTALSIFLPFIINFLFKYQMAIIDNR